MLYMIGLGLIKNHITQEALECLKKMDYVYLDTYTSQYSEGQIKELSEMAGKEIIPLSRKGLEEEFIPKLVAHGKRKVCLAVFGNPLNATTHVQLLIDAHEQKIPAKIIPGISIFEYVSFTGLDRYKFGKTTTIVFHEQDYEPESFYDAILENKKIGLHTLCLLDIKKDQERLMSINHAISVLERIEERREKNVLSESVLVGIAGAGSESEEIRAGTADHLKAHPFTLYPQSLIVCGKLNEKETEGLRALSGLK